MHVLAGLKRQCGGAVVVAVLESHMPLHHVREHQHPRVAFWPGQRKGVSRVLFRCGETALEVVDPRSFRERQIQFGIRMDF